MNLFKSKSRIKIESRIKHFESQIEQIKSEKQKVIKLPDQYAKLWSIEKDYIRNVELLKELL